LHAQLRRADRGVVAGGAGADDDNVELLLLAHFIRSAGSWPPARGGWGRCRVAAAAGRGRPAGAPAAAVPGSEAQHHAAGVLELVLDVDQEQDRVLAVDDAVVVGQRDVHHRRGHDLAVLDDRALLDRVHAEDRRLRRAHDRGREQRAEGAAVGDGERAALQVLELEPALARGLGVVGDALPDLGEAPALDVAQPRRDQAAGGGDRHRDVGVAVVDDVVAVDRGVDDREALQRVGGGLGEEAHEAELDAVLLLELLAQLLAQGHDLAEVDLVERGQHRDRLLRLHQALGDALADAGHRHPLLGARAAGDRAGAAGGEVDQVLLGHRAAAAGALHLRGVDAVLLGGEAGARRQVGGLARRHRGGVGGGRGGGFRLRGALLLLHFLVAGGALAFLGRFAARVGGLRGAFLDDRQHLLAGDGVAFGELDLLQHAVDRRGDLGPDLVGLQVDQVLIAADGIPDLLVPAGDGGVGHGFGKDRDFDFGGHGTASLMLWGRAVLFGGDLVAGRVDQG